MAPIRSSLKTLSLRFQPYPMLQRTIFRRNTHDPQPDSISEAVLAAVPQLISQPVALQPMTPPKIINVTPFQASAFRSTGITVYASHFLAAAAAHTSHDPTDVFYVCPSVDVPAMPLAIAEMADVDDEFDCDDSSDDEIDDDPSMITGDSRRRAGLIYEREVVAEMASGGFLFPKLNEFIYHEDRTQIMEIDAQIRYRREVRPIDGVFSDEAVIEMKRSLPRERWGKYLKQIVRRLRYFQNQLIIIFTRPNQPVADFMAFVQSQLHWNQIRRVRCVTSVHEMREIIIPM